MLRHQVARVFFLCLAVLLVLLTLPGPRSRVIVSISQAVGRAPAQPEMAAPLVSWKGVGASGLNFNFAQFDELGTSWWYAWSYLDSYFADSRFVPMIWGVAGGQYIGGPCRSLDCLQGYARAHPGRAWLLLNEPERGDQANMEPTEAAGHVNQIVAALRSADPSARTLCCGTWTDEGGLNWMRTFLGGLTVSLDGVHVHAYYPGWAEGRGESLIRYYEQMQSFDRTRGLPIWITEVGHLCAVGSSEWVRDGLAKPFFAWYFTDGYRKFPKVAWYDTTDARWPPTSLYRQVGSSWVLTPLGEYYRDLGERPTPPTPTRSPTPTQTPTPVSEHGFFTTSQDTYLDQWSPDSNYGSASILAVRSGDIKSALLQFDLTMIPPEATIFGARLHLYAVGRSNPNAMNLETYQVRRSWVANQATWRKASASELWAAAGCNDAQTDRSATPSDSQPINALDTWATLDVTDMVRQWVSQPASNRGLLVKGSGGVAVQYDFASSRYHDAARRPRLEIWYLSGSLPSATPDLSGTPTGTPTTTASPTTYYTPTPTEVIPRRELWSYQLASPPAIDGNLREWSSDGSVLVNMAAAASVAGLIEGDSDLSMVVRSRWDRNYVYLAMQIQDDQIYTDSGGQVWHDDGVEIALDGLHDGLPNRADDHQYTYRADGYFTDYGAPTTGPLRAIRRATTGYDMEVAIPASALKLTTLAAGRVIGFTLGLHDDDDGGSYDAYLIWEGSNTYNGSAQFGHLILASDVPTATPTATATATPTSEPLRITLDSLRIIASPVLDGRLDEWSSTGTLLLATSTASTKIGQPADAADASMTVRSRWDDTSLYFGIRVRDDVLYADSGFELWRDDAVEIALDGARDRRPGGADDHQYVLRVDGGRTERGSWPSDWLAAVQALGDGYEMEIAIPLSALGRGEIAPGTLVGFTASLRDDDDGSNYDSYLVLAGEDTWSDSAHFGNLRFLEAVPDSERSAAETVETRILQWGLNGYTGVEDTYIVAGECRNVNFAGDSKMTMRSGDLMSLLLRFDLAGIPSNAMVLQATLELYAATGGPHLLYASPYRVLRPWAVREATWDDARHYEVWAVPGCNGVGVDREEAPSDAVPMAGTGTWYSLNVTSLVSTWIAEPLSNWGMIIKGQSHVAVGYGFLTSEWPDIQWRPKLTLTYLLP